MQEILDNDLKNTSGTPLEDEFEELQYWLFLSGILFLIVGSLGVLAMFIVEDGPVIYYWLHKLCTLGLGLAFITTLPMAFAHFQYYKSSKKFCQKKTKKNFEKLLIASGKDWRLLAFIFIFPTIGITPLMTYTAYKDWDYYPLEPIEQMPPDSGAELINDLFEQMGKSMEAKHIREAEEKAKRIKEKEEKKVLILEEEVQSIEEEAPLLEEKIQPIEEDSSSY